MNGVAPVSEQARPVGGFSIELPAKVRLMVPAESPQQAEEIMRAILGNGGWIKCDPDCGGIQFALKVP